MSLADGVYAKLDRADEHFKTLHMQITAALQGADNGVRPDPNQQPHEASLVARVNLVPDIRWSVLIGDCLYNLRSALDHLAWQLAAKHGSGTVPNGSEFPIFRDKEKFIACSPGGSPKPGSGLYKIRGIDPAVQVEIEEVQPYNSVTLVENPLFVLHELSNHDKHRLLHFVSTVRGTTEMRLVITPATSGERTITPIFSATGPIEDGAQVVRFVMGGTAAGDKMTVEGKVMFDVAFDEGSAAGVTDQPVAEVLNQLTFRTRQLVDHFVQTAL